MKFTLGQRVRFTPEMLKAMGPIGKGTGTVVPQPIGSFGSPPPGGLYVLWDHLREPAPCFEENLVLAEDQTEPKRRKR